MLRIILAVCMVILFAGYNPVKVFAQNNSLTAGEIVVKAIEAQGGEETLRKLINSVCRKGSLYSPAGEFVGETAFYFKKPGKIREERPSASKGLSVAVYNDHRTYMMEDGQMIKSESRLASFKRKAELDAKVGPFSLLYLLDHQNEVRYLDEQFVNGRSCYRLEIFIDKDARYLFFFDVETFFAVKIEQNISFAGDHTRMELYFYDFKKIDNLTLPFRTRLYANAYEIGDAEIRKISFDELDDKLFEIAD